MKESRITVPERADPFVRELYRLCRDQRVTMHELARKSGVGLSTIDGWRHRSSPRVSQIEACFNALGHSLRPIPFDAEAA